MVPIGLLTSPIHASEIEWCPRMLFARLARLQLYELAHLPDFVYPLSPSTSQIAARAVGVHERLGPVGTLYT
jgi:hypothetical protein